MCKKLVLQNVTNIQIKLASAQNKFVTINNIVAINGDLYENNNRKKIDQRH